MAPSADKVMPREARLAAGILAVFVMGGFVLFAVMGTRFLLTERRERAALNARLGAIEVGWTEAQVRGAAGAPDAVCEGNGDLAKRAPESRGFYVDRALVRRLARKTARRFIYRKPSGHRDGEEAACLPGYAEAELGFDAGGRLIWYVRFWNESYLVSERPR